MGYCIDMTRCNVGIKGSLQEQAMKSMKAWIKTQNRLSWVYTEEALEARDIIELMDALRYEVEYDEIIDVYSIEAFNGEKLGDDYYIFETLAPFMTDGYMEYNGEDGAMWRYTFKNGKMKEAEPRIEWEEE
jgi:hypothetical protein